MSDLLIPIANCKLCKDKVPVVVLGYTFDNEIEPTLAGTEVQFVYCAVCESLLSINDDIEIEWYESEELPKVTNYSVKELNELS